jgi:hypothetical protein
MSKQIRREKGCGLFPCYQSPQTHKPIKTDMSTTGAQKPKEPDNAHVHNRQTIIKTDSQAHTTATTKTQHKKHNTLQNDGNTCKNTRIHKNTKHVQQKKSDKARNNNAHTTLKEYTSIHTTNKRRNNGTQKHNTLQNDGTQKHKQTEAYTTIQQIIQTTIRTKSFKYSQHNNNKHKQLNTFQNDGTHKM